MRKYIIQFLALCLPLSNIQAKEVAAVCAKYQDNYGWSQPYQVNATILNGSELNQATNRFDYDFSSVYVAIFWSQEKVTLIKLNSFMLTSLDEQGVDQNGRLWSVAKSSYCF